MDQPDKPAPLAKRLKKLSQTSRETDMGRLLRRFWQPVALSADVAAGQAKALRVFGEELTLYRGESGAAHLVGGRCAHRLTLLHTGWVQGEDIRCIYHGWKYDGSGQCNELPAEASGAAGKVRIAGYPVQEYCGLIFAYLGDGPAPEFDLPRKDAFERPGGLLIPRAQTWHCNWLQHVENSLDAVHVSFVHQAGKIGPFGAAITASIPQLEYLETDAGIRQIATRSETNVRISDWTFPNNNHIVVPSLPAAPWADIGIWMVPVDDESTVRFILYSFPALDEELRQRILQHFDSYGSYSPADHHDELFNEGKYPDETFLQLTGAQDYVATLGQGTIVDRSQERLGKSDAGIIVLRRLFWREMAALAEGGEPKQWRRLSHGVSLPKPVGHEHAMT
jgi:5,5'-dehydrodivanillate O-demethylase